MGGIGFCLQLGRVETMDTWAGNWQSLLLYEWISGSGRVKRYWDLHHRHKAKTNYALERSYKWVQCQWCSRTQNEHKSYIKNKTLCSHSILLYSTVSMILSKGVSIFSKMLLIGWPLQFCKVQQPTECGHSTPQARLLWRHSSDASDHACVFTVSPFCSFDRAIPTISPWAEG